MSTNRQTLFFDRLEVKYLIDRTTRTALTRDLAAFMRPDQHAGSGGGYRVRSLYFDTPDYMAYHEKIETFGGSSVLGCVYFLVGAVDTDP